MHLLRVGRRIINIDFLVMAEEFGAPPAADHGPPLVEVTMHLGRTFRIGGPEATAFLDRLYLLADTAAVSADVGGAQVAETRVFQAHPAEGEHGAVPSG